MRQGGHKEVNLRVVDDGMNPRSLLGEYPKCCFVNIKRRGRQGGLEGYELDSTGERARAES
jgi:hypothetical protein